MVSQPSFVEFLQLLDAVSRMASLGFEKSYREAIVLIIRSYLGKLSIVGSAESRTQAPEATTERVEVHLDFELLIMIMKFGTIIFFFNCIDTNWFNYILDFTCRLFVDCQRHYDY